MIGKVFVSLSILQLLVGFVASAKAQDTKILASWTALNAPTGYEYLATGPLMEKFEGWRVDKSGNMSKTVGNGDHHRVVACALDAHSFAVSQITENGYLRLHHIGRAPQHPLWSAAHEGQQLRVLTREGPLVGVSALANGHFANLHRDETALVRADDLWLDVGATSSEDVHEMGINILDPVIRHIPAWSFGDVVAGPSSGARVGCAAIVAGGEAQMAGEGRTTWLLSTGSVFNWIGLSSALLELGSVDELILVGRGEALRRDEEIKSINGNVDKLLEYSGTSKVHYLAPKVSHAGSLMERIDLDEANNLLSRIVNLINDKAPIPSWVGAPKPMKALNAEAGRLGKGSNGYDLATIEILLDQLVEISAVSGHEGPIRAILLEALPEWARVIVQTDELGNIWIDVGPKNQVATVFMAHMDEVGWDVESIEEDGIVHLRRRGGAIGSAREGQPALMQLNGGLGALSSPTQAQLKGVFLTRDEPTEKRPESLSAWFGMDAVELKSRGVEIGMPVTGNKEGHRMGKYRYSARSLDDRVGTTALLLALQEFDPTNLKQRVIFAWSVQEEIGLYGATAMADKFGSETKRIYSIDTFVSSDTPLESPHFAYAPLGKGPVLRSIESSGMVKPKELDRNKEIARSAGIKVQIGMTQGGTDGTAFTYWGAPNGGLSWPGRYSHGPAEIADLRDVQGLVKLIGAMARATP